MNNTPADVLAEAIVQARLAERPSSVAAGKTAVWPIFINTLPEKPDECIVVYDTTGRPDGRIMRTGETIRKPGWQVRVRARDHTAAFTRMSAIQDALDLILRLVVDINGSGYTIDAVTQTSGVLPLGQEPDAKRREGFTLNGTITHKEQLS